MTIEQHQVSDTSRPRPDAHGPLLFVVEGTNDVEFLKRISQMLHSVDETLPCLGEMESAGELIFIPFGGGHVRAWSHRLAPLQRPEFHLYDSELPPETDIRQEAANNVNRRRNCVAVLTRKRCLENYLHPEAIRQAGGIEIQFDDLDSVSQLVARRFDDKSPYEIPWKLQSRRARNRKSQRCKHWLNTSAAARMTIDLLSERDPDGEVLSWMHAVQSLLRA